MNWLCSTLNPGRLFQRDGSILTGVETWPVVGFIMTFLDIRRADQNRAIRSSLSCIYATVIAGVITTVGDGPTSIGLGIACATSLAICLQEWLAGTVWGFPVAVPSNIVLEGAIVNGLVAGIEACFGNDWISPALIRMGIGRRFAGQLVQGFLHWLLSIETWPARNGWLLTYAESIPAVGFLLALLDLINGNKDRALRACAKCACATAVVVGPNTIGKIAGGGPIGMGLGAACTTPLAVHLQWWLAVYIQDPHIQNEVLVYLTPQAVLQEVIANGLVFGLGAQYSELLVNLTGPVIITMGVGRTLAGWLHGSLQWCLGLQDQDVWVLKCVESVPVVGFWLALLDLDNGEKDRALCASAQCACATIVVAVPHMIAGGGPISMGFGAVCATPLAMHLQSWIAQYISDPIIRNEVLVDLAPESVLVEAITNGLTFGFGTHFNKLCSNLIGPVLLSKMGLGIMLTAAAAMSVGWMLLVGLCEFCSLIAKEFSKQICRLLRCAESIPVVGLLVAFLHLVNRDKDQALRASAKCVYTTLIFGSKAIGEIVGGGDVFARLVFAGLAAASATPLAMYLRSRVAGHAQNPGVQRDVLDLRFTTALRESRYNGLVFGLGTRFSELFANSTDSILTATGSGRIPYEILWYLVSQTL